MGGMLELKIRVRDPLLAKQVEDVKEKWLVIDSFDRVTAPVSTATPTAPLMTRVLSHMSYTDL